MVRLFYTLFVVFLFLTNPSAFAQNTDGPKQVFTGIRDFFWPSSDAAGARRYAIIESEIREREHQVIGTLEGIRLSVHFNSIVDEVADAYLVPQTGSGEHGDPITEVIGWEAKSGLIQYNEMTKTGQLGWGEAVVTKSGEKSKAKNLIQVRLTPGNATEEFSDSPKDLARYQGIVKTAVRNALLTAHSSNIQSIAIPPLAAFNWYGHSLSPYKSAESVAAGIKEYIDSVKQSNVKEITIAVYPGSNFINPAHQYLAYEGELAKLVKAPVIHPTQTLSYRNFCSFILSRFK